MVKEIASAVAEGLAPTLLGVEKGIVDGTSEGLQKALDRLHGIKVVITCEIDIPPRAEPVNPR